MNIGIVAKRAGIAAKTIRYYEQEGLIPNPPRNLSGYRQYNESDVQILKFIERARSLGFPISDVSKLLGLWSNKKRKSADVKKLAQRHIEDINSKIHELQSMRGTLNNLVRKCTGDDRPNCPILEGLEKSKKC